MAVHLTPARDTSRVPGGFFARIERDSRNPNRDIALQLRDIATWLLEHPELPEVRFATISLRAAGDERPHPRRDLDVVAHALIADELDVIENHRCTDDPAGTKPDTYEIVGRFGQARVVASASTGELSYDDCLHPDDGPPAPILESYREHDDPHVQLLLCKQQTLEAFRAALPAPRLVVSEDLGEVA